VDIHHDRHFRFWLIPAHMNIRYTWKYLFHVYILYIGIQYIQHRQTVIHHHLFVLLLIWCTQDWLV
jgi:hypothetical protein